MQIKREHKSMDSQEWKVVEKKDSILFLCKGFPGDAIFVFDGISNIKNIKNYKNIRFASIFDGDGIPGIGVTTVDERYNSSLKQLFNLFSNYIGELSLEDIIDNIESILAGVPQQSILKFRGDLAEALFLYRYKEGRRANLNETYDINWNNKMVEIKSFSPQQKLITISHKQLMENTSKFTVRIEHDDMGLGIIDLAERIDDKKFGEYLISEYSKSKMSEQKFRANYPVDQTKYFENLRFSLPDGVISAKLKVSIKDD